MSVTIPRSVVTVQPLCTTGHSYVKHNVIQEEDIYVAPGKDLMSLYEHLRRIRANTIERNSVKLVNPSTPSFACASG